MNIRHIFGAGTYVKETRFYAGEWGVKHTHNYPHVSYLASGDVELQVDGVPQILSGPCSVMVEAGKSHRVHALSDAVWLCIHATDCQDADHIDNVLTRSH